MRSRSLAFVSLASASLALACGGGSSSEDSSNPGGPTVVGAAGKSGGGGASGASGGSSGAAQGGKATGGASGAASGGKAGSGGVSGKGGSSGASTTGGAGGSSGSTGKAGSGGSGKSGSGGTSGSSTGGSGTGGAAQCTPIALQITPSNASIDVVNGAAAPMTFSAKGICADQTIVDVAAQWSFDRADLASITPGSGVLTANGDKGGTGTVTATAGSLTGQAEATITVHVVENPGNVDAGTQAMLDNPGSGPAVSLVYPYDGTVFARGILAPEIMWNGGQAGDVYLVHVQEQYFDAKIYVTADPPSNVLMSDTTWNQLTVTNGGDDVQVDVVRLSGGTVSAPAHESWKIAQGSLRGSIYYWAVNLGQLVKIAPAASSPTVIFDSGPPDQLGSPAPSGYDGTTPPWQDIGSGKRCVACHVVSKDGSTLASVFSTPRGSTGPWGSVDLTTSSVIALSNYVENNMFEALTPEGKYLVANTTNMRMHLADAKTGANISSALDSFGDNLCDPAFSHDGTKLAFAGNVIGSYPVEYTSSSLDLLDFDGGSLTFSNRRTVLGGNGQAIAFPSFAPGSDRIVYQKGDYSRAKYGSGQHGNDDLYVTDLNGSSETFLAKANGAGVLDAKNQHLNYQPTVNPIAVGGYFWVVFVSPRDYGNKMVSTSDPTYENRKQLWVAAIDLNAPPGQDPSHPAFLLRGQDQTTVNMSGYWSLEACHQNGTACSEGFECCSGFCRQDAGGNFTCVDMPAGGCSATGEKCVSAADCCADPAGVDCIGGFCAKAKP